MNDFSIIDRVNSIALARADSYVVKSGADPSHFALHIKSGPLITLKSYFTSDPDIFEMEFGAEITQRISIFLDVCKVIHTEDANIFLGNGIVAEYWKSTPRGVYFNEEKGGFLAIDIINNALYLRQMEEQP